MTEINPEKENIVKKDGRFEDSLGGEEYDDLLLALDFYQEFQEQPGKALSDYIQEHCAEQKEINILEAGPGTGITSIQILKADKTGDPETGESRIHLTAVDNEEKMLNVVKEKFGASEEYKDHVEFVLADILEYLEACEDNSLDAFVSVYTIHNFTTEFRNKVIAAIARKLKPGGVFINGDKYSRDEAGYKQDLDGELKNYEKFEVEADKAEALGDIERAKHFRQIHKDWIKHMWEDDVNQITVEEQNKMLEELGFQDIIWMKRFDLVTTVRAIKKF